MLNRFRNRQAPAQTPTRTLDKSARNKQAPQDSKQILHRMLKGYQLPSFPNIVMEVMRKLRNPDSSLTEIAETMERDPGMSVRLLKTVNSAAFGLAHNVGDVGRAVTMLGRSRVEALIVSVAVKQSLPRPQHGFNSPQFWQTSARRASLARLLAEELNPKGSSEAFTAGLLQDLAVPVLVESHQKAYSQLYREYQRDPDSNLYTLERKEIGFDHALVGAHMAKAWHLPLYLAKAIAAHHVRRKPEDEDPALAMVSLMRDSQRYDGTDQILAIAEDRYNLNPDTVKLLIAQAYEDAADLFS